MATLEDALQTILAADYGLNEGDHLKLCDILKKAHGETKKCTKEVASVTITPLNICIYPIGKSAMTKYYLDTQIVTMYKQRPGQDHVPATYEIKGRIHQSSALADTPHTWSRPPQQIVGLVLDMFEENGRFFISQGGISTTVDYEVMVPVWEERDVEAAKARAKYEVEISSSPEEGDDSCWRGDFTYNRFRMNVIDRFYYS